MWDFTPPGDLGSSGAWTVVRELALTLSRREAWAFVLALFPPWKAGQECTHA